MIFEQSFRYFLRKKYSEQHLLQSLLVDFLTVPIECANFIYIDVDSFIFSIHQMLI